MARTKIICTIGPAVNSLEKMMELIDAGMNVARLNFSHGTHEEHLKVIQLLKEARLRCGVPLGIMLDTKGPEIRLGKISNNAAELTTGQEWMLVAEEVLGDAERVSINPGFILERLEIGNKVLFNDGYINSKIVKKGPGWCVVKIENGGIINSGKGVNVPGTELGLPAVTEKDIHDIRFGCKHDIDFIAASFVRSPLHVLTIKKLLADEKKSDIQIISKIENQEGVHHFDSIVQVSDGIMIARGDLGVEVPLSRVPMLQKMMIRKCSLAGKPSVTATQMLESMIQNPRPTRAEASDVANAIYDSTSAVMLSGETAVGKFPIEAVKVMREIAEVAESDFDYRTFFDLHAKNIYHDVPSSVTLATVKTTYSSGAQAIFALTTRGGTARLISRLRPSVPIIAMTTDEKTYHQMSINWGVTSFLGSHCKTINEAFAQVSSYALNHHYVDNGDLVVLTGGTPFDVSGTTNSMLVESIGDVLVRGDRGIGSRVYGNASVVMSATSRAPYSVRDRILVIPECNEAHYALIRECSGVVLQNQVDDTKSEEYLIDIARKMDKTVITRGDAACHVIKEGQLITLDPEKALVYKGVVFG